MNNNQLTTLQILQELQQKINSQEIGFWIDNQDCYLWEKTFHYSNKVKVGDLSLTKEKYWANWMAEFDKLYHEKEIRNKILEKQFQDISDVALMEELRKRVKNQTIELSMYSNHQHIYLKGKDINVETSFPLPIEIKENDQEKNQ